MFRNIGNSHDFSRISKCSLMGPILNHQPVSRRSLACTASLAARAALSARVEFANAITMTLLQTISRIVIINALTLYYSILTLGYIAVRYIRNPFSDPWAQKLRLEPPACLTDPKYGNHKYIKVNVSIVFACLS